MIELDREISGDTQKVLDESKGTLKRG